MPSAESRPKGRIKVTYRGVDSLKVSPTNPRTHSDVQVGQIMESMDEFGFTNPVLVDEDNSLIAGHGRLQAAERLGLTSIPTITLAGLTEDQKRAYLIADNKLALNSGWDEGLLRSQLEDLEESGVLLDVLGFSEAELAVLLADVEDVVEDPLDEWVGMPEFEQDNEFYRTMRVHFRNEEDVQAFIKLLDRSPEATNITPKTQFVWYPEAPWLKVHDMGWTGEGDEPSDDE